MISKRLSRYVTVVENGPDSAAAVTWNGFERFACECVSFNRTGFVAAGNVRSRLARLFGWKSVACGTRCIRVHVRGAAGWNTRHLFSI